MSTADRDHLKIFAGRAGVPTLRTPFHQMEFLFAVLVCAGTRDGTIYHDDIL